MATIVVRKSTGDKFIFLGSGFGAFQSKKPNWLFGDLIADTAEGQYAMVCVCDFEGTIGWFESTEMEESAVQTEQEIPEVDDFKKPEEDQQLPIDFAEDEKTEDLAQEVTSSEEITMDKTKELEQVMNSGMQFLSGLFKMSTGKDMGMEDQKIEIDKKTGEVTMKFKLPF